MPDDLLDVMDGFKEFANAVSWGQECANSKKSVAGDALAHAFSPEALLAAGALHLRPPTSAPLS